MAREIVCPCGHKMKAEDDEALFQVVRDHVDDEHPELNYGREEVIALVGEKAYDA